MLEAALFPRKLASNFRLFTFVLQFMLDPGPNPVPEPECITVPLSKKLRFLRFRLHNTVRIIAMLLHIFQRRMKDESACCEMLERPRLKSSSWTLIG
jgi:hypothetical protein